MHKFYIFCLLITLFMIVRPTSGQVVLNKLVLSNGSVLGDHSYEPDFNEIIEIYNIGPDSVNLDGYGLTNDDKRPLKWQLPAIKLGPGEHLFVKASGKDKGDLMHYNSNSFYLHTNFRLSATGAFVGLALPNGEWVDSVTTNYVPRDMAYGRYPDGTGEWHYFPEPIINDTNRGLAYSGRTKPLVEFSQKGGHYQNSFTVSISSDNPGDSIYYTLDGTDPDTSHSLYNGPLTIDTTTLLRARVIETNKLPGEITSSTYLFNQDVHLPVISIVTDPDNLWDPDIGIYTNGNYLNKGGEWERFANFEYFDHDGLKEDMPIGLRIHGGFTRQIIPQKSLRVYARGGYASYGSGSLDHKFFEHLDADSFKRLILRQSGNDWNSTMFRSAVQQILLRPLDIKFREYQPAIVYLNGSYWGIHNIRDRDDKYGVGREAGVHPDSIYMIANRRSPKYGDWPARIEWVELQEWIDETDLSIDSNYKKLQEFMDLDNKATYYTTYVYANNHDWPGNNNIKYRSVNPEGKWRWVCKDFDFGFGLWQGHSAYQNNMLYAALEQDYWANVWWSRRLMNNLLENESFKHMFINRFADHLNSWFLPERVISYINNTRDMIADEIPNHIDRWGHIDGQFDNLRSIPEWENNINRMRTFAQQRPTYQRQHIRSYFNINGQHDITLNVISTNDSIETGPEVYGGRIRLNNNITIDEDLFTLGDSLYPWTGIYFDNIPITLEAIPEEGYTFSHWEGDVQEQDTLIEVIPTSDLNITAVFKQEETVLVPQPHIMSEGEFLFNYFDSSTSAGEYPPHMIFEETSIKDPDLEAKMGGFWELRYNKNSRSRINGLNEDGFSFINTANPNDGGGYLGSAILALNTTDVDSVHIYWEGGTVTPNKREYAIRLQYRIGHVGPFYDFYDENNAPVEYVRNSNADHQMSFGPYVLPEELQGKDYIQLRWKYYYIETGVSGPRAELNINEIHAFVPGVTDPPKQAQLISPFNNDSVHTRFPEFHWHKLDNTASYNIQIDTTSSFEDPIHATSVNDTFHQSSQSLKYNKTYYWQVRGINSGGVGEWSETWSFHSPVLNIPGTVQLNYPENEDSDVTIPVNFTWHAIKDTPAVYHMEVATDPNMDNVMSFKVDDDTLHQVHLSGNSTYYWRVKAENEVGIGNWSEIFQFETASIQVPGNVMLVSPEDNASIQGNEVKFVWNSVSIANEYMLNIALDQNFSNVTNQIVVTDTSAIVSNLEPENTYWWRVRGQNNAGSGQFSDSRTFDFGYTFLAPEKHDEAHFKVFPNPASGNVHIHFNVISAGEIIIDAYTISGRYIGNIFNSEYNKGMLKLKWDTSTLANGMYLIKIQTPDGYYQEQVILND